MADGPQGEPLEAAGLSSALRFGKKDAGSRVLPALKLRAAPG
jgi:hypothetical protein